MKKYILVIGILVFYCLSLFATQQDTTQVKKTPKKKKPVNRVYYGGNIGLSFGNYFRISVSPLVGYKLNPKASLGVKVGYEYVEDKRYDPKLTASNYGGSVFTRYRLVPQVYAHAEFAYLSYKYKVSDIETNREWIPFLLLGGGYIQQISPNAAFVVEVLFDVLQDSKSPYKEWDPFISVGVGVGF
jgi:hypothetical protein